MWKFAKKRPRALVAGPKAIKHLTVCRQCSSPGGAKSKAPPDNPAGPLASEKDAPLLRVV